MNSMIQIVKAEKQDINALAALFAQGFMHDPLYCHYVPYEKERYSILLQIFTKYLTDFWEEITVFVTADRKAGLCICPDDAQGTNRLELSLPAEKVYRQINHAVAPQFYQNYLVLDLLAVDPQMQGKGIAKALVGAFINTVKLTGRTGIVEIYEPANLGFYQKLGFRLAHIQPVGETLSAYLLEWNEE